MQYIKLGNSDLNVSRICMGCMGFGDASRGQHSWTVDESQTREIIRRGLELGINFYDTAIAYQSGTSERYVGKALRDFAKRDDVVIATKFLPRTQQEIEDGISGQQHISNMLDMSLKNLGVDYVDLYIYHMWDWQTDIHDILDGLNRAVKAGKIRYWIMVKKVDSKKLFFMLYVASQIRLLAHLAFALHSHYAVGAYCRNHLCM